MPSQQIEGSGHKFFFKEKKTRRKIGYVYSPLIELAIQAGYGYVTILKQTSHISEPAPALRC